MLGDSKSIDNGLEERAFLALTPENISAKLRKRRQWVCWRMKWQKLKNGQWKLKKVPYNPETRFTASTIDPSTWSSLERALEAFQAHGSGYDGIGFVFSIDDPYTGVDLDKCRDPETGEVAPWAQEWIVRFDSYTEVSPTGTGVHIIVEGETPHNGQRTVEGKTVEMYSIERYFTVTGEVLPTPSGNAREIVHRQDAIDKLAAEFFPEKAARGVWAPPKTQEPVALEDEELLQKARKARNGKEFAAIYDRGEFRSHPSHSEARMWLLKRLAFWTGRDADRMSRLYERSALYEIPGYAKKWARLRESECKKAIAETRQVYQQGIVLNLGASTKARTTPKEGPAEGNAEGDLLSESIEAMREHALGIAWEGRSGPTDRHVYDALLELAATYGAASKKGVVVAAAGRPLALLSGTSHRTVIKALKRLCEERKLAKVLKRNTGGGGATYLLPYPVPQGFTIGTTCVPYGEGLRQLRNPGPTTDREYDKNGRKIVQANRHLLGRLGKPPALVIEKVAAFKDGATLEGLAVALNRRKDNLRRIVAKLLDAGLLESSAGPDGLLRLPKKFAWRLQVELEESGCLKAQRMDAARYAEESEAFEEFRSRKDRASDEAPSEEDMADARAARVCQAIEALELAGSGPNLIFESYALGDTQTFEYVVRAVAHHYSPGAPDAWPLWWSVVKEAYTLITGEIINVPDTPPVVVPREVLKPTKKVRFSKDLPPLPKEPEEEPDPEDPEDMVEF